MWLHRISCTKDPLILCPLPLYHGPHPQIGQEANIADEGGEEEALTDDEEVRAEAAAEHERAVARVRFGFGVESTESLPSLTAEFAAPAAGVGNAASDAKVLCLEVKGIPGEGKALEGKASMPGPGEDGAGLAHASSSALECNVDPFQRKSHHVQLTKVLRGLLRSCILVWNYM